MFFILGLRKKTWFSIFSGRRLVIKQFWVFLVNAKINHQKLKNEGLRYLWCTSKRVYLDVFLSTGFSRVRLLFWGPTGPACANTYTLLIYSPFRGTGRREPFLLGYETPMKWPFFRKQQNVEGDYCMSKNKCNCYCYTLCILTDRAYTLKYVLQICIGLTKVDT